MSIEYRIGDDGKGRVYYNGEWVKPGFSFKPDLFQARIDGTKTETRRLDKKPRFEVGQLVYVKEALFKDSILSAACYLSDGKAVEIKRNFMHLLKWRWKRPRLPAMFMPGEAARYIDRIVEVNQERLQDITEDDVWAEGIECRACWNETTHYTHQISNPGPCDCMDVFIDLWDSINPTHPWDSNPKVVVYKWERVI